MPFREVIEAVLKVKDATRFKHAMDSAARSVRKFGRDEEEAAAQTELLREVSKRLEHQSIQMTAALKLVAHEVDELGDQMTQTAAKSVIMNAAVKKSGSNAIFLGKSWAFWKDRLSLTRSEIMTTALTISAYFAPAIIAMGSSFAYAAIGGGGVALGGLSTFVLGLGALATVMKPVVDGVKKVKKAQDQYNLTVEQYGAASIQASRASAHLYGVIRTNGGQPVLRAATNLRNFTNEWKKATAPARGQLLGALSGGLKTAQRAVPTLATGTNEAARSVSVNVQRAMKTLTNPEMLQIFRSMFQIFDKAIGPGIRGFTNLIMVLGRIIVATGPWVVKWAQSWERTTKSWRDGTRDTSKLSDFFDGAVKNFKAWWGLAKALGRTLKIIFGASKDEGLQFVGVLTNLVNKFNDWLNKMSYTGQIRRFWKTWEDSLSTAFFIFQHPVQAFNKWMPNVLAAIDKWLPVIMTHIANTFAHSAGTMAWTFVKAFFNSGAWSQFFIMAILLRKFGVFKALGAVIGRVFVGPFFTSFAKAAVPRIGALSAAEGGLAGAFGGAGTKLGGIFGKAFMVVAIGYIAVQVSDELTKLAVKFGMKINKPGTKEREKHGKVTGILEPFIRSNVPGADWLYKHVLDRPDSKGNKPKTKPRKRPKPPSWAGGGALGGIIPMGSTALVGETGPELATMGATGTQVTPLNRNSRHTLPGARMADLPNLRDAMNVTVYSYITVDRREIARAVNNQNTYEKARRGGMPRPQQ